ncbi:TonB family protein [Sessilibacter corallicola]
MGSCLKLKQSWKHSLNPNFGAFFLTISLHSLFFSHASHADLNGMSVFDTFGKDKYIAALYLDAPTDKSESAMQQSDSAVMEFLIVDRSISRRGMARLWAESVSINADDEQLEKHASELAAMTNLIKGRLVTGDKLRIKNTIGGIALELNDVALGEIESQGLFDLLLQTWIGEVPPSTKFREQLLAAGQINSDLLSRFNALQPTDGRVEQITSNWLAPVEIENNEQLAITEESTQTVIQSNPEPAVAASSPAEPTNTEIAQVAKQTVVEETSAEETNVEQAVIEETTPAPEPAVELVAEQSQENVESQNNELAQAIPEQLAAVEDSTVNEEVSELFSNNLEEEAETPPLQVALAPPQIPESTPSEESVDVDNQLSVEELLEGQKYYTRVKRKIYRSVVYPNLALRAGREGNVALDISLDASGQVVDTVVSEKSQYRTFDREATRAVKRSAPFPPPPEILLEDDLYQFKVILRFQVASD